jgi:D-3-phosphoglycerate dehydrogenase
MKKVLIPQDISPAGKQYLSERGYNVVIGTGHDTETLKREIADADAALVRTALYPAEVIEAAKKLKIIARYGVGTDNIDVKFAEEKGIWVTIAKNANLESVAEHTIALILALAKDVVNADAQTRRGNFEFRNTHPGTEIKGKTLGLIGLGAIGLSVASKAHFGFNMNVVGFDAYANPSLLPPYVKSVSFEQVIEQSDVVSIHIPATPESANMFNKDVFKKMKPTACLINCARGGIINEGDLYDALAGKIIKAAAMDCFEEEPTPAEHPLFTLNNFIATPHSAGLTNEANSAVGVSCAMAIDDVLSGKKPQYPINNPKAM